MQQRDIIGKQVRDFCEDLWQQGDPWDFEHSEYEKARCEHLITMLESRQYGRVFEIGCGAGYFTRLVAPRADYILATDIARTAIERARTLTAGLPQIDFRVANVMDYGWQMDGSWDLVIFNDAICYLGWLYPFFDVAWLAAQLFAATQYGGRLLMANTMHEGPDKLLLPYITRTYRDLFLNVGYRVENEEIFRGVKNGVEYEILMSLFLKDSQIADGSRPG
jgi:SAM-dependent methyltransferase